jgi:hypothetical protein
MKYLAHLFFGFPSMETYEIIEASSELSATDEAYARTVEWAESFGFEQDEPHFGELDSVGRSKYDGEYEEEGFIDSSVELYIPEKHDGLL